MRPKPLIAMRTAMVGSPKGKGRRIGAQPRWFNLAVRWAGRRVRYTPAMRRFRRLHTVTAALGGVFALLLAAAATAREVPPADGNPARLIVGVYDAPPFSEPGRDGESWGGSSIRLFSAAAARLSVPVEFRAGSEVDILAALATGEIDACASPLAPTVNRLDSMEFTHAFASLGLAAAERNDSGLIGELRSILDSVLSPTQYRVYAVILIFVLLAALLVWIAERKRNPHFGGGKRRGIGSSLWWSVVTLSTVGYGDKVPMTFAGRSVAAGWMIVSLVLTTILTATIVSAITVGSIASQPVSRAADLFGARVVSVRGSIGADWLSAKGIPFRPVDTVDEACELVKTGEARAIVAPRAELAVLSRSRPYLVVSPVVLSDEFAAFAFRKSIDPAFLARFDRAVLEARSELAPSDQTVPAPALTSPLPR